MADTLLPPQPFRDPATSGGSSGAASSSSQEDEHENHVAADDENDEEMTAMSANLRSSLKVVRDPTKTAFDVLPTGETLGSFANRHAIDRYARKVEGKRERAREIRMKKRKLTKSIQRKKEKSVLPYGPIDRKGFSGQAADGAGAN